MTLTHHLQITQVLLKAGQTSPALMMANSHEYLNFTGHIVIAWQWLEMATAAAEKTHILRKGHVTSEGHEEDFSADFLQGKRMTARYFFRHELPKTVAQAALLVSMEDTNLVMKDAYF